MFTTIGTPQRKNNLVTPWVDGEDAWKSVSSELIAAKKTIHMTWWMMANDFELLRPVADTFKSPHDRDYSTIRSILLKKHYDGVKVRILLWDVPFPYVIDNQLRLFGKSGIFELMYESHPTKTIGSWHQKTVIIDDTVAFVGGMNTRENDWDTSAHVLYNYRRTPHSSSGSDRSRWLAQKTLPEYKPRHDLMAIIRGPLVQDVAANFSQRWNYALSTDISFSRLATPTATPSSLPTKPQGNIVGQVSRTMPSGYVPLPSGEQGILDTYIRAIRSAKEYIYIEDQYFRSQVLAKELAIALGKNNNLILIVITQPDYASNIDPDEYWKIAGISTKWTAVAFDTIRAVRKDFCMFYLQVTDVDSKGKTIFQPINLHAKIMIVDDVWYTVGSCNVNDRGFQYEGEINVSVLHQSSKNLRKKLVSEHLVTACPDNHKDAFKLWFDHSAVNHQSWKENNVPKSRVFPFVQKGPLFTPFPHDWL